MGDPVVDAALEQASNELGLETWYRDCVRPLIRSGPAGYPGCCGGGCEPCNQILVQVAERVLEILGRDRVDEPAE
ncbi:MAG: hypothetical protein BGO98_01390 [Myxococcales bacterium 68-20]|nr:hypothetical protein [Myxococcales bacterium]OJY17584.1 MAG: hypothetical protein BGO98_01390 [Myxococcales bacterium 68-20]